MNTSIVADRLNRAKKQYARGASISDRLVAFGLITAMPFYSMASENSGNQSRALRIAILVDRAYSLDG